MVKKGDEKPKLGFWRENVEALAVAIVMALTVKVFAIEAFKVPTESMEPTIVGRASGGDRLIVNKAVYQLRDPRRWEVVVFQYPHNTLVNYVKRAVGLPGEWLFIRNGDVWTAPAELEREAALAAAKVARKPEGLQERLFDLNRMVPPGDRGPESFRDYWEKEPGDRGKGQVAPLADEERIEFRAEDGATLVRFKRPQTQLERIGEGGARYASPALSNRRFDDWSPFASEPGFLSGLFGGATPARGAGPAPGREDEVGDLRLRLELRPEAARGAALLEIRDGTHDRAIRLRIGVEGSGIPSRLLLGDEEIPVDAALEPEEWTELSLANADDRITVRIDGDLVLSHEYVHAFIEPARALVGGGETRTPKDAAMFHANDPPPVEPTHDLPFDNEVFFGFEGGRASVRDVELSRDVYYTVSGPTDFRIPDDGYLMLGDNSTDSLDGRGWKVTVLEYETEDGEVATFRGDAEGVGAEEPRPFENPFVLDGETLFIDELGNTRVLDPARIRSQRTEYGHFVRRRHVQGRAYLTFWPLLQIGAIR